MASLKHESRESGLLHHPKFHDRAVVASLKPMEWDNVGGGSVKFHDRAVVASLKPRRRMGRRGRRRQFHDRAVVASLKPGLESNYVNFRHNSTTARSWPH